ncbi:MAG: hypothetical protein DI598_13855 [Pseudopedobacter saltans]|uniref:Baseplate structural protein Gp10 C-terminal domain-containing protein n=1 Tax=Pseudopedobacter saltans TaxID=151895 RepID=A0A2W5GP78_9SPHI|nr:MAG: hypothetical protein DI598_13855 [Pseudopedobacter saltans]
MIKHNYTYPKGFPGDQAYLQIQENSIADAQSIGLAIAKLFIISGCKVDDGIAASGIVSVNGEVMALEGGNVEETVFVESMEVAGQFGDGVTRPFRIVRTLKFGTGNEQYNWADFKLKENSILDRIEKLEKMCAPIAAGVGGSMMFWNKPANTIPDGWQEVLDWRSRMPIGYDPDDTDFNTVGKTGGEKTHQLTIAEMPAHRFKNGVVDDKEFTDSFNVFAYGQTTEDLSGFNKGNISNTAGNTPAYQGYTNTLGSNAWHNNMSPYRTVLFIEFVG